MDLDLELELELESQEVVEVVEDSLDLAGLTMRLILNLLSLSPYSVRSPCDISWW